MSYSFTRDRTAELRGETTPRNSQDNQDDGFGPRRTPAGYTQYSSSQNEPGISNPFSYNSSPPPPPPPTSGYQSYEMHQRTGPADLSTMPGFFDEMDDLKREVSTVGDSVQDIQALHNAAIVATNESQARDYGNQLVRLKQETAQRNNDIKNRIKAIEQSNFQFAKTSDGQIRQSQTDAVRKRFLDTIQRYQDMERAFDERYRQRIERQIRIVKPDASQQEIDNLIDSEQGDQVFTQSLMQAGRTSQARAVLSEVQDRHQDIKRIEKTIVELHQLFMDMQMLVEQQGQTVTAVEAQAQETTTQLEHGNRFIDRAIKSAKATRTKKWCCFFIVLILCVVIGILVWWFAFDHVGVGGNTSNNSNNTSAKS
ncbi:t-SNARE [Hesseltinella vesiculosa]|uniref:t-SNARE n=1 Tax=Hesseltinella vesiculosa TaxID=101127 RepID=A0A1X2G410_9FUNG|nr:t-SNARE [Hesseltinella vesiculosa]